MKVHNKCPVTFALRSPAFCSMVPGSKDQKDLRIEKIIKSPAIPFLCCASQAKRLHLFARILNIAALRLRGSYMSIPQVILLWEQPTKKAA
jgi:hypothetical protein